jgi:hypothetical protein
MVCHFFGPEGTRKRSGLFHALMSSIVLCELAPTLMNPSWTVLLLAFWKLRKSGSIVWKLTAAFRALFHPTSSGFCLS